MFLLIPKGKLPIFLPISTLTKAKAKLALLPSPIQVIALSFKSSKQGILNPFNFAKFFAKIVASIICADESMFPFFLYSLAYLDK